jgi:hypothetical protein
VSITREIVLQAYLKSMFLYGDEGRSPGCRGMNSSHVLYPSITPRTYRQLPTASGGNMNLQTLHETSGFGASR